MSTMTREEIEQGLQENRFAPGGTARNAHAEVLAAAAEASGDSELFRDALDNLINSYLYSSESTKMLVPFARLLQEYDKDPGAFSKGGHPLPVLAVQVGGHGHQRIPRDPPGVRHRLAGRDGAPLPHRGLQRAARTRVRAVVRRCDR
ncbi:hypothetical protein GCM10020254_44490 [Streptomyces goshikiensis]